MHLTPRRTARGPAATLGFLVLLFVALGITWGLSRIQYRERPRWDEAAFPALGAALGAPEGWSERWVVAVHPGCPHCHTSLESVAAARDRDAPPIRTTALIVDAPRTPPDSVVADLPADETRWDADGRWRRRWGHRVYGEVMCFDGEGRLRRLLPPFGSPRLASTAMARLGLAGEAP